MGTDLKRNFFARSAEKVAEDLIGKILVRKFNGKVLRGKIIETEAYFGEEDPASWARHGKRKDNYNMWEKAGTVLVKNVHKYMMLNFVTGREGKAEAVLIRALLPINSFERCSGPGLLTKSFFIEKSFNGKNIFELQELFIEDPHVKPKVQRGFRIGVKNDLKVPFRFYIKGYERSGLKNE